jgi:hypothetical protein
MADQEQRAIANDINRTEPLLFPESVFRRFFLEAAGYVFG